MANLWYCRGCHHVFVVVPGDLKCFWCGSPNTGTAGGVLPPRVRRTHRPLDPPQPDAVDLCRRSFAKKLADAVAFLHDIDPRD